MANIKFSQFTVGNTESDIDFVVGYKGANNIQISPTNLLSSTLSGYLPLTGGTMIGIGSLQLPDNFDLKIGSAANGDAQLYHNGSRTELINFTGELRIVNTQDDGDIRFRCDNGSGGTAEYFRIDGGIVRNVFSKNVGLEDNVQLILGAGNDLQITHDGTNSEISNLTGNLNIKSTSTDGDISFYADDGAGGITTYFRVDGGTERIESSKSFRFADGARVQLGSGSDMQIHHTGGSNFIEVSSGGLSIRQNTDDGDISFQSDDGSGSITEYFRVDGSSVQTIAEKDFRFIDNVKVILGTGSDLEIYHNATDSVIENNVGDLYITNKQDDGDIVFRSDDGGGGFTTYLWLDGANKRVKAKEVLTIQNSSSLRIGDAESGQLYVESGNTVLKQVNSGNIAIRNEADDSDIIFSCDDGSGGVTEYFRLDGSQADGTYKYIDFPDNSVISLGDNDAAIFHDGTDTRIKNETGDLFISQFANDKDIIFRSDDGAGGVTDYFKLDGSLATGSRVYTVFPDNSTAVFGSGFDFQIHHDASNTYLQQGGTGDLYFQQNVDDRDIIFQADDGSGGITDYFKLDGSDGNVKVYKQFGFLDNVKATFGNSGDLEVYHSGSHSFINGSNGAGSLYLRPGAGGTIQLETPSGVDMISTNATDVRMYSSGNERLRVKNIGINIQNVPTYADNTAAIAGGLITGDVYRTGDLLKIVH